MENKIRFNQRAFKKCDRILKIMKISFLMLFFCFFTITAENVFSQQKELSLELNNVTLKKAISEIEKTSDYVFLITDEARREMKKKVSIRANKESIQAILENIFNDTDLAYTTVERQVSVYKNPNPKTEKSEKVAKIEPEQQNRTLRGKVTDEDGIPLPGVTITVVGFSRGVITDNDGNYSIEVNSADELEFSFVGLETQRIKVGDHSILNVILKEKIDELEEVTVVAFGKQKKESVIGSISTISPADLKIPSSNLTTALAGNIAGVISYQRSGEPGLDNADFFIRGVTTFGYKVDPLILIDNVEVTSTELARLQVDDIASFSIMKDATATALYGARGANGVILITTKQGPEGKAKMNIRYESSISRPTQNVELADPVTYMRLHNEAVLTRDPLGVLPYSNEKIDNTLLGIDPYIYPATNWKEILIKDQAINHRVNLNVQGGGQIARYFVSGAFNQDNGILNVDKRNNFNSNISLKTYSLRSNININLTKTTEMIVRLSGNFDDYTGPIDGGTKVYRDIMRTNPVLFPPYYTPGIEQQYITHIMFGNAGEEGNYLNPYANMVKGYKNYSRSAMVSQMEIKQKLDAITNGLSFRTLVNTSRNAYFDVTRKYNPFWYRIDGVNPSTGDYVLSIINEETGTEYLDYNEGSKTVSSVFYLESALDYLQTFNEKHSVSALLVFTMRNNLVGNAGTMQESLAFRNMGLSGRSTYGYDNRYFLEFNFGYNGSERFYKNNRFGFFPSAGFAWNISNEDFFQDLQNTVSDLKIRSSYGLVGNDQIGSSSDRFFYLSELNMTDANRAAYFGTERGYSKNGISINRYSNRDITWEISYKSNIAIELGLFNKLSVIAEYFKEDRKNILMTRSSIPTTMGLSASVRANVGEASGEGIDISMDYNHFINNNFWIQGRGNFTYATSKYKVYEEPDYNEKYLSRVGYPLSQQWGYVAERLFIDDEEVANSPKQNFGEYMGGDIKYLDINGDGQITTLDRVPIGYPTVPEIIYGFGLSTGIKNFDFSTFFQGSARSSFWIDASATAPFNSYIYPGESFQSGTILQNQLLKAYADNVWTEENRNIYALWPRLSTTPISNNLQRSTWFMRDGSFLRLKQVELGYTIPSTYSKKLNIEKFRIYANGSNLALWSKFKLWDVEMAGNGLGYPIQKVYNIGINITL